MGQRVQQCAALRCTKPSLAAGPRAAPYHVSFLGSPASPRCSGGSALRRGTTGAVLCHLPGSARRTSPAQRAPSL
eukprot:scaffold966_cov415-Prasinococcus_capsulatus_cf.AAC.15